ncbi:MAG: redoxin domain-containing protein [Armatimonadota bacterium]|nr:redoxin domain-containing protein [Armatimonadota bacterium]
MPTAGAAPKSQEKIICAVCGPREGAGAEPVKATATYKGKGYAFCSTECKVEFLESPNEFLVTDEGKPAPAFTLKNLQGQNVSLSDFKGKVVLADFWGSFCIPCVEALPALQSLHQKYAPKGFIVIGISVDEKRSTTQKTIKKANVSYPILMATPQVWSAYKVNRLPSLVLIGRDGRIIKRYGGEADKRAMVAEIERALAAPAEKTPEQEEEGTP